MIKNLINELKDKKILILGFGREGRDTLLFLKKLFPKKKIGIADRKLSKDYLKNLDKYDVIIKSPGIPFKILPRSVLGRITSQTEIFFDNCPGKIIGITGTKGKSTTASLIYDILKAGKIKAHLVGNIGKPVLNLLPSAPFAAARVKDVYVYELSSFQLTNLKKSPHIAVLLNIYQEHLDYYRSFKEYAQAKANITLHQTKDDFLIYNSTDKLVSQIAKKTKAKIIPIKGGYYNLDRQAAKKVGKLFKIPKEKIEKAINNFKPLPHRLEPVGTYRGVTFYNDSLATIPEATIAALDILGDRVETIFLGGFDRKIDFKGLAKRVLQSKIKNIILFPTSGKRIWEALRLTSFAQGKKLPKHYFLDNMQKAVKLAYKYTGKGKICLLSCASPSFGLFKDYAERGDLFKKYVKKFGISKR